MSSTNVGKAFVTHISSETISMPLLNELKATLKADVDVTEMNKYLQAYIQEEVKTGVANALVTLVEDIVNNKTEEAELRITEKLKEEVKKCVTNALVISRLYVIRPPLFYY
jgi:hypothetical protein